MACCIRKPIRNLHESTTPYTALSFLSIAYALNMHAPGQTNSPSFRTNFHSIEKMNVKPHNPKSAHVCSQLHTSNATYGLYRALGAKGPYVQGLGFYKSRVYIYIGLRVFYSCRIVHAAAQVRSPRLRKPWRIPRFVQSGRRNLPPCSRSWGTLCRKLQLPRQ